jgi:hypothetical protein
MYNNKSVFGLLESVNDMVEEYVTNMRLEPASRLGLDDRCGKLYVDEDCIVARKGLRVDLDYYGGFEYIKGDDRAEIGEYVVYFATSERVADAIECLMEFDGECASEDA